MDSPTLGTEAQADFTTLLEESFAFNQPERGDLITGEILSIDGQGIIVDVGLKRDGVVPRSDLEKLGDDANFEVGQEIVVMVVQPEDYEGNLVVSVAQARQSKDWTRAQELLDTDKVWEGVVTDANRGGLIVPFGNLRGFIPASHVMDLPRGLNETERQEHLAGMVGRPVAVKVIEVNRRRRRLVLSQREALRGRREKRKENLLEELNEGEVRQGVVSGLRDFGAFVDLGGADGLIHISELAWHRVRHPSEILSVGDEIDVFILRLDKEGKRIGLSLKRLQPNPWLLVDDLYHVGQLVEGEVSRVTDFGAFISMDPGIEALLHTSQIADEAVADPREYVREGERLVMRIISIESHRQRLGLSLKEVGEEERRHYQGPQDDAEFDEAGTEPADAVQSAV
ncbi:MAG: S1 RNA-binding domain-containing protein [Anaerolineae bacterium]|nr:S1 RNA-binding domain-containing protein [Anaerolineae bacterium]